MAVDMQAISLSAESVLSSADEMSIQDVLRHGAMLRTCCCF